MKDVYPTDNELKAISNWEFCERSVIELLEYLRGLWWMDTWGFHLKGKHILRLELHTGGWSGNEDIIEALRRNYLFWMMCWEKTLRGGHYYFRIEPKRFKVFEGQQP